MRSLWTWAKANKLGAITIVLLSAVAFASASDSWSVRRVAARYFDLAKGWAAAYHRDTEASKKEYEARIKVLTEERNAYKTKWEDAKGRLTAPWIPPRGAKELQARFNKRGYKNRMIP